MLTVEWYTVCAAGRNRDLWVDVDGHGRPKYGDWITPRGLDVSDVLETRGPEALDVPVHWSPRREHKGERLTDLLWQTKMSGFKLTSTRLVELFRDHGARLETYEVDIRTRAGDPVEGYLGVLEETKRPGPVHSLWKRRRSHRFVVSADVVASIRAGDFTGLEIEPAQSAFPG